VRRRKRPGRSFSLAFQTRGERKNVNCRPSTENGETRWVVGKIRLILGRHPKRKVAPENIHTTKPNRRKKKQKKKKKKSRLNIHQERGKLYIGDIGKNTFSVVRQRPGGNGSFGREGKRGGHQTYSKLLSAKQKK